MAARDDLMAAMSGGAPDGGMPSNGPDDGGGDEPLTDAANDLIECVHKKDVMGVKAALQAAFMFLEQQSQPPEAGPDESAAMPPPAG